MVVDNVKTHRTSEGKTSSFGFVKMKHLIKIGFIFIMTFMCIESRCTIGSIQDHANMCLADNMMDDGTDFLVPIVNGSAGVVNFCKRTISDIKNCITSVISTCASDKKVKAIFGSMGSALLAAYDGICQGEHKEYDLTCAYQGFSHVIKELVNQTVTDIDHVDAQTGNLHDLCMPLEHLHMRMLEIYDEAIEHGDCSVENKHVMHEYLSTLVFPCQNVATSFYPCTLQRLNNDIIQCYASYGAIVKNGIIPTPASLTHAGEMCLDSAKGMIQNCIKNLITKCLYEPQISAIFGSTGEPYVAAYDCMCSMDNSDMIMTCASAANISSVMSVFMNVVHNHSLSGMLDKASQCGEEKTLIAELERIIYNACADPIMRSHWKMYIGTVFYMCTEEPTHCYPDNKYNGAQSNATLRAMLVLIFTMFMVKFYFN